MKNLHLLLILSLLSTPSLCFADWGFPEDSDIVFLDIFSHDRFLKEYPEVMVYYHIEDCAHCKDFKPIYSKLALEFKERKRRLPLAQFDCSEHRTFCMEKMIPVYPYLKFFVKEHPILYHGKRTYEDLKKYLEYMADRRPDRTSVKNFVTLFDQFYFPKELDPSLFSSDELEAEIELRNKNKNSVLGVYFGRKNKNKKLFKVFDQYFKYDENTEFLHIKKLPELTTSNLKVFADVMSEEDNLNGKVVLFFKGRTKVFKGKATFERMEDAVHEVKYPRVNFLNTELHSTLGGKRDSIVLLFVPRADHWSLRQFSRLANQYRKKHTFVVVSEDSEYSELVVDFKKRFLHLEQDSFDLEENPQLRLISVNFSFATAKKYILPTAFSYDTGLNFLIDFKAKKLKPFFLTETNKEEFFEGTRIRYLTGQNYESKIRVPGQISMVLYHDDLETNVQTKLFLHYLIELSNDPIMKNLEFFLVDASKNEIPDFFDDERPVVLLYSPRNLHSPLIYNGAFNKYRILKLISRGKKVKTANEQVEKVIFGRK